MSHALPSRRGLVLAWGLLAGLTVASMVAGLFGVEDTAALGWPMVAFILAVTWVKANRILAVYLNLRVAPAGWRGFLGGLVLVILGLILGGHLLVGMVGA